MATGALCSACNTKKKSVIPVAGKNMCLLCLFAEGEKIQEEFGLSKNGWVNSIVPKKPEKVAHKRR